MTTTTETAVQANEGEAHRLYLRGVAAARAGQKRVAAGLLTRSVRLDPRAEMAWLWLSGVLDDPQQQAFCLSAVLKLNPQNQHALRGISLLEERGLLKGEPRPAAGLSMPAPAVSASTSSAPTEDDKRREAWWVGWRRSRREMSRARLLLWAFPIIIVGLAIVLYESFALAVERSVALPAPPVQAAVAAAAPTSEPTIEPILEAEPLAVVESLTASYLGALEPVRANLRVATTAYRSVTNQVTGGSVGAVAATQRLRATIADADGKLKGLHPPATLQQAHDDYARGLELELKGLDALLAFYSGYDVANANRAAIHFQEARAYIERAQGAFGAQARQIAELSAISSQTAR
jgi:hypothetical protein